MENKEKEIHPTWFYDTLIYMLQKEEITEEGRKLLEKWYCDEMVRGGKLEELEKEEA